MKKVSWEVRAGPQGSRVAHVVPGRTQTTLCRAVGRSHLEPLMGEIGGGRGATGAGAQGFRCVSMLEDDQVRVRVRVSVRVRVRARVRIS